MLQTCKKTSTFCVVAMGLMSTNAMAQSAFEPEGAEATPPSAELVGDSGKEPSSSDFDPENLEQLDSEIGMLFETFDVVVTAGRTAQASNLTGVPVSVLLADEIHASGVTSVPLLLDFVPGVNVLQIDRNRFAVGVRGLHHEFSDRTLVLLDGRNAGSGLFGGVDFQRLPVFMEDLERVEVVRGPGGAVWGANAFQGVINLIAKDPRETQGSFLSTQINTFGDVYTHARWGASKGNLAWRISAGWDGQKSSSEAIDGNTFESRDFSRVMRVTADAVHTIDESTELKFGIGYTHTDRGDFSFLGLQPGENERLDYTRLYASYDTVFESNTSLSLDLFTTLEDVNRPSLWRYGLIDTQLDGQLVFDLEGDHRVSVGASTRVVQIDSNPYRADMLLRDKVFNEQWGGAYIADTWKASDRLTIEAQGRVDWYSETTWDWSGRLAGLIPMDPEKKHMLRLAVAKAFRAPQASIREIQTLRVPLPTPPFPSGTFGSELIRAGKLDNEEVYSIEAGYFGLLGEGVTFRFDGFYQFYQDLTGARLLPDPLSVGRVIAELDNLGGAEAWGVETELSVEGEDGKLSLWYAYQDFWFTYDTDEPNARAFLSPEHSVGLRGNLKLSKRASLTTNYRYSSVTHGDGLGTGAVQETHRLDVSLAHDFLHGRGEIAVGVQDLFDETDIAVDPVGSPGAAFETPGRTVWVRVQLNF